MLGLLYFTSFENNTFKKYFLEKVFGIKMVYTGNSVETNKKVLFILNHRTRYDWYFFFSFVFHSNILSRHKISLKAILKWFPGIGDCTYSYPFKIYTYYYKYLN